MFDRRTEGGAPTGYFCPFVCFTNEVMEKWCWGLILSMDEGYLVDSSYLIPIVLYETIISNQCDGHHELDISD